MGTWEGSKFEEGTILRIEDEFEERAWYLSWCEN